MVSSAIQFWGCYIVTGFARDDYIFGITDYVLSFEGIYFLYENLENVNYNHNFNAHEVSYKNF